MDWSKGYSASYHMTIVDPVTWRDISTVNVKSGQIKREDSGLMQSASIDCGDYPHGVEQWVRIYLTTKQGGDSERVALFTGLATSPDATISAGRHRLNELECYSVLKPADDIYLMRGWYAPTDISCTTLIEQLLSVSPAPINPSVEAPPLRTAIIAEDGETRLTMVERILNAINWRMRIEGDGTITLMEKRDTIDTAREVAIFDPLEYDVIETKIKITADWFNCPNVFMAILEDMIGIARDESVNSALSVVNRGREVWMQESDCILSENETIASYAQRRLKEEQRTQQVASYDRRYDPRVMPGDVIRMHYPAQNLDGLYYVSEQSIDLGYGAKTSEQIMEVQ